MHAKILLKTCSVKARSHRAQIRKVGRRIQKADADYPQKRKARGRLPGSLLDQFFPCRKVCRFGRNQSGPETHVRSIA